MAFNGEQCRLGNLVAGEDLSGQQHRFVKLDSDGDVVAVDASTDLPIGVLGSKPQSGQSAAFVLSGVTKVVAAEAIEPGDVIGTADDGRATVATEGVYAAGHALTAAAAAGELFTAYVEPSFAAPSGQLLWRADAGEALTANRIVTVADDGDIEHTAGSVPIGVAVHGAAANSPVTVCVAGVALVQVSAAINERDYIASTASGQAVATTTDNAGAVGIALTAATAANQTIRVLVAPGRY